MWFIRLMRTSCNKAFGNSDRDSPFQSEMNDDHLYRDPEYSWDEYIQAYRLMDNESTGEVYLDYARKALRDG